MIDLNYLAVAVASGAVFVFAAVYYTALSTQYAELSPAAAGSSRPPVLSMALELAKGLVVAAAVAALVGLIGITNPSGALLLGLVLWVAFPVMLLVGSVVHENVPWKVAALHAADWLAKLLLIAVIVTIWR